MADGRKFSELEEDNTPSDNHRFVYLDPDEPLEIDKNKTGSLSEYFDSRYSKLGGVRTDSNSFNISTPTTVWYGSAAGTGTLPAGVASIIWKPYYVANDGSANLTIDGNGTDSISNSDPFILIKGTRAIFMWDGVNWVVF